MVETVKARVSHRFKASAERVFDAWLDPEVAHRWMQQPFPGMGPMDVKRVEIDPRVGGRFTFSDMRDDGEAVHWGCYREIDRPVSWCSAGLHPRRKNRKTPPSSHSPSARLAMAAKRRSSTGWTHSGHSTCLKPKRVGG
ncbi:SRPBCC domain-containing protein [Phyllobacterium myrsinacearum]|uniref:SRPBCC family protein n=1 Tax=Phyllobacterium myrsinacearum TaxID=28101 RepID=UPI001AED4E24